MKIQIPNSKSRISDNIFSLNKYNKYSPMVKINLDLDSTPNTKRKNHLTDSNLEKESSYSSPQRKKNLNKPKVSFYLWV